MANPPFLLSRTNILATLGLCLFSLSVSAQTPSTRTVSPGNYTATVTVLDGDSASGYSRTYTAKAALKTNLLAWAVATPNIGIEIPIGNHFSVGVSGTATSMIIKNTYALKTILGGIDGKYWFDQKGRSLTGWNAGVYAMFSGDWDVQWKGGWQGDSFTSVGVVGGYSLPIHRYLNLEFALAVGWFYTPEARKYEHIDGLNMWTETRGNVHRFSLTKAQVNLVWLIGGGK